MKMLDKKNQVLKHELSNNFKIFGKLNEGLVNGLVLKKPSLFPGHN